jgi:hypothetical protein
VDSDQVHLPLITTQHDNTNDVKFIRDAMSATALPIIINCSNPGGSSEALSSPKFQRQIDDSDSDSEDTSKIAKAKTQSVRLSRIVTPTRRDDDSETDESSVGSSDDSSEHATKDQIAHSSSLKPLAIQSPGIKRDDSNDSDHSSSVESKQNPVKQAANDRSQIKSKYTDDSDDASSAEANKNRKETRIEVAKNHSDAESGDSSDDASRPTQMQQALESKTGSRSRNSVASISYKAETIVASLKLGEDCGSSQSIQSIDVISHTLDGSSSLRKSLNVNKFDRCISDSDLELSTSVMQSKLEVIDLTDVQEFPGNSTSLHGKNQMKDSITKVPNYTSQIKSGMSQRATNHKIDSYGDFTAEKKKSPSQKAKYKVENGLLIIGKCDESRNCNIDHNEINDDKAEKKRSKNKSAKLLADIFEESTATITSVLSTDTSKNTAKMKSSKVKSIRLKDAVTAPAPTFSIQDGKLVKPSKINTGALTNIPIVKPSFTIVDGKLIKQDTLGSASLPSESRKKGKNKKGCKK